ncbi:MAG: tRNA 2-thiouridine(34) synthase MnmA [Erysipelotrichaceae bacterium]|nr:tRNA 2-thiouridine(34) synthase MnmA [Erysipelotrichaceae bacterium]
MLKVLVGLSGGVDSAVAAHELKEAGYDVTCCFMRNWDSVLNNDTLGNNTLNNDICPQEEDYNDAKKVADRLGLQLLRSDYIEEYWNYVFKNFIDEYEKGRTPNPDILCNKYIKFDYFLKFAKDKGFDYIATGHYFKAVETDGVRHYYKALDLNKDQSYFLAQVNKQALDQTLFPLADITKDEVRSIAHKLDLNVADKKDSTGICFIGERNFREFLKNYIPMKKGKIIDIDTLETIGEHDGVYYYTIGQRKGFGVGGNRGPYYCVGKDVRKNILYLTSIENEDYLNSDCCLIEDINWIENMPEEMDIECKFRYRQQDNKVHLAKMSDNSVKLTYPQKIKAVTPGQQAVFYKDGMLLGGGVIESTYYNGENVAKWLDERVNNGRN